MYYTSSLKKKLFHRLLVSLSECDNLDDLQCCSFFTQIGSKYEIVDFVVCEGNEKYCRHKYVTNCSVKKYLLISNIISVGHWLLLAYGIISLDQHLAFLAFVPFPAIFYIITVKFTDPGEFHIREERSN